MSKRPSPLLGYAPIMAAFACALVPLSAHADNWFDNMFTFRKDQKPLVQPHHSVPPRVVYQPYYPDAAHTSWSNFYTRTDLEPQDYLSSSASKVMRVPQHPDTSGANDGGWPAIAERARENAMAESNGGQLMIGEPGESWSMNTGNDRIGRAMQIGDPVHDWRDANGGGGMPSRPGDFDYHMALPRGGMNTATLAANGGTLVDTDAPPDGAGTVEFSTRSSDPRYTKYDSQGRVVEYAVQKGDTLGGISSQEAIYNNWKLWPLIYSANRRAIGGNPDNLKLQQRLDVPRDYTDAQAKDAERKSGRHHW